MHQHPGDVKHVNVYAKRATLMGDTDVCGMGSILWPRMPVGVRVTAGPINFAHYVFCELEIDWLRAEPGQLENLPTGCWLLDERSKFLSGDRECHERYITPTGKVEVLADVMAVSPAVQQFDVGVTVTPALNDYADAVSCMWRSMLEAVSPQPQLDPGVRHSDKTGIEAARAHEILDPKPEPVAPSRVKPALAGLGVTASGDHRLGRFNVAGD